MGVNYSTHPHASYCFARTRWDELAYNLETDDPLVRMEVEAIQRRIHDLSSYIYDAHPPERLTYGGVMYRREDLIPKVPTVNSNRVIMTAIKEGEDFSF